MKARDREECMTPDEALRESEERFRALSEATCEGVVIHEGGRILEINDAYVGMFGYSREELIGKTIIDLVAPESRESVREHVAGRVEEPYEFTGLRKDGTTFPAEVRGRTVTYMGRQARAAVIRDLSERKKIDRALREAEERLRLAVDATHFGAFDFYPQTGELVWSVYAKEHFGLPPDAEVDYDLFLKGLHPEDRERVDGIVRKVLRPEGGGEYHTEYRTIGIEDGKERWLDARGRVFFDDQGTAVRFIGGTIDITERKRVEEELGRSRDLLQAVIDNTPAAIYIKDLEGTIILANKAIADLLGRTKEEMIGKTSFDFYPHEVAEDHTENDREVMRRGRPVSSEEIVPEDGGERTFLSIKFPLKDDDGRTWGVGGVSSEITERVRAEQMTARALEESRRDRERLAAMENIAEAGISTTEVDEVLDAVAGRIAEALGTHSCTILLVEDGELVARSAHGIPGEAGFRIPSDKGFPGKVLLGGRTVYVADAEHDPLVISPHIKRKGVKSLLGAPMIARGHAVGVLYVAELRVREFTSDERRLLEAMASRTALIVENTRLYEELARSRDEVQSNFTYLQRSLLPAGALEVGPGYRAAMSYVSPYGLEIGGDFYDLFDTEVGCHGVLIGDVAGKGVPAVSLATTTRSTVRALAYDISCVGEALTHANSVLCPQEFAAGETAFVTALVAVIDPATGEFRYASAGHPPPAVYRRANDKVEFLKVGDPPLRVVPGSRYEERGCYLNPGDKVVLYTDGLSEARRGKDLFGPQGIRRVLRKHGRRSPDEVVSRLNDAALRWSGGNITDDTLILVVERE